MADYKSVQDLIIKAAFYGGVSTTISAEEVCGCRDMIKIIFSKDTDFSVAHIDMHEIHEEMALHICKSALHKLLWAPYDEIEYNKEN
jgi:hypothetical protein